MRYVTHVKKSNRGYITFSINSPRHQGELIHVVESTIDNDSTRSEINRCVRGRTLLSD